MQIAEVMKKSVYPHLARHE